MTGNYRRAVTALGGGPKASPVSQLDIATCSRGQFARDQLPRIVGSPGVIEDRHVSRMRLQMVPPPARAATC
jgi:hypothetical protein